MLGKLRKIEKKEFKTKENKKFTKILFECDIKINDKWELVLSFTYKWTYNNTSYKDLKMTVKSDVGIFKLNNCFNNNELQTIKI